MTGALAPYVTSCMSSGEITRRDCSSNAVSLVPSAAQAILAPDLFTAGLLNGTKVQASDHERSSASQPRPLTGRKGDD
jgi:hypothetical protein